jgi:uncharacterized membrane protein YkvA (DUF1232 family)
VAHGRTGSATRGAATLLEPGIVDELRLSWRLLRDPRVAPRLKVVVPVLATLYLVSPIDLVPDLFLGLGQIDDLGVIGLAILVLARLVPRLAPPAVVREHMAALGLGGAAPQAETRTTARGGEQVIDARFRVQE